LPASTSPAIALPGPGQNDGVGWEFVHVCIGDHARLAYVEVLDDETGDSCARFLARAVVWFARHGVCVRRVMTDNGTGYRSHLFRQAREALGLRHLRTRPYTPKTNGNAERFIKTMLEDWAYAVPYRSSCNRRRQLPVWLRHYNHERPHGSLAGLPPASRLPAQVNNLVGMHS
jgi:transposase InsO family protein